MKKTELIRLLAKCHGNPEVSLIIDDIEVPLVHVLHFKEEDVLWLCAPDEQLDGPSDEDDSEDEFPEAEKLTAEQIRELLPKEATECAVDQIKPRTQAKEA